MRKTIIAGNWKMHLNVQQSSLLVHRLSENIKLQRNIEVILAPSLLALQPLSLQIDRRVFGLAAQNAYYKDEGAYTGEISFAMLRGLAKYVIIGHSERRIYFHENLETIRDKVAAAVRNEIAPILCVGETKHERSSGETKRVLHDQIISALSNLISQEIDNVVIAYEPIWAISSFGGELAKPPEVARELAYIRRQIAELYGQTVAEKLRILYGGSVDDQTAGSYLELPGCDGALVGAASLNWAKFSGIVSTAEKLRHEIIKAKDPN
ncbi:MAG: triose-phosphate isomerase [Candidatus Saccharimonadales bacterium]